MEPIIVKVLASTEPSAFCQQELVTSYTPAVVERRSRNRRKSEIGLALLDKYDCPIYYWHGTTEAANVTQLYHALKLLDHCTNVSDDTLCACYYAMGPKQNPNTIHYLDSLRHSGFVRVDTFREEILNNDTATDNIFIANLRHKLSA